MKTTFRILGYTALLSAVAGGIAIATVPSLREQARDVKDRFMGYYQERENELIAALSSTDAEVAKARKHRAEKTGLDKFTQDEEPYEF